MDLQEIYKKETGFYVGKIHDTGTTYYSEDYVYWLEKKLRRCWDMCSKPAEINSKKNIKMINSSTKAPNNAKPVLPAVFLSGKDKVEQFKKELKELLAKYDAELTIEDFGRDWSSDEKMVVTFNWDEDLANRTNDGIVPDWVVGRWENGR